MTRDALREAAAMALRAAKRRLEKKHGELDMYFVYVLPDGKVEREDVDSSVPNSPDAKAIQFRRVRERASELKAEAVIMVSDAWMLDSSAPNHQAVRNRLGQETACAIADDVGVVEAARLGLGRAMEVIQVILDTPGWHYGLSQEYEKVGGDRRFIRFLGDPLVFDDSDGVAKVEGRGLIFFEKGAA